MLVGLESIYDQYASTGSCKSHTSIIYYVYKFIIIRELLYLSLTNKWKKLQKNLNVVAVNFVRLPLVIFKSDLKINCF